ncbi:CACTA en-spm transposon protein [Cucumis melo var. makuwa]|nr:CACTA en-spm transposon protein [Cucumis melo var. makuwa]
MQVFYIDDPKLRSIWKIVQIVPNKQVWDVPEVEELEDDRLELLEASSSIEVDESIHDIPFCRSDVEPTVVDHGEIDNQDQSPIDDDFINDEPEQLESSVMVRPDQAQLALTEVEQTNTPPVDPYTPSGYGRNIELDKFVEKHGKVKIEISEEEGKPVTTFAPTIALDIGTAVRNTIPLSCENRKAVPMDVKELVIDRITHEDWNMMCDRWETDAWKKKQETNKKSRSGVKFNHVTRAKSFLQVRHELKKKKGCDVDEVEVFHETHFREKEGWINDKAKNAYRIIAESTEAGVQTISSAKACEIVLGSRSIQTVNPKSGESLGSNMSSTREKEKNEMTYLKEVNEKLTHELAKWEQRWTDVKKKLDLGAEGEEKEEDNAPSNT